MLIDHDTSGDLKHLHLKRNNISIDLSQSLIPKNPYRGDSTSNECPQYYPNLSKKK
jgi:hypothetical protein